MNMGYILLKIIRKQLICTLKAHQMEHLHALEQLTLKIIGI